MMSSLSFAHGPTPQKIDQEITVNANTMTVWKMVKSFDSLAKWHPLVKSIVMTDPDTRVVTLKSGGEITDSLDEVNQDELYISYRLLEENTTVFPASFYTINIQVKPDGSNSKVTWSGRFYRGDTGNFPAENLNDESAVDAMENYAKSGLQGLKSAVEKLN
jgi:carbon monoxide dehydrogenase subunit G